MPKKNSLFVSVAALALLITPVLAQPHEPQKPGPAAHGREAPAARHSGGPKPAPTAFPPAPGQRPGAAPAARPQGNRPQANRPGTRPQPNRPQDNRPQTPQTGRPGGNPPGRPEGNRPGNNDRPGFGDNNRPGRPSDNNRPGHDNNRPGFGSNNRPGGAGFRPGGRPDFSSFQYYHRSVQAARRFHAPAYRRPQGWYYRRWSYGQVLPSLFWAQQYWLNDYGIYDLPPPPPGAVWVRYGNDALLIDRYSGEIISIQYNVFY